MEVDRATTRQDFVSGRVFSAGCDEFSASSSYTHSSLTKKFVPLKPVVLNPSRPAISASGSGSKGVDLQPVDLIQIDKSSSKPSLSHVTYWSGNW